MGAAMKARVRRMEQPLSVSLRHLGIGGPRRATKSAKQP
jgi:hypothetical protein